MSDVVTMRECTSEDAPTLALIGAATLLEAFAGLVPGQALLAHCANHHVPGAYSVMLANPETRIWIAEVPPGAAPVGYAILTKPDFPGTLAQPGDLELRRIYVFSRFHGGGTGRRLMDLAVAGARAQGAKRLLLGVHPDNQRALAFYRKNGFEQIGTRSFHVGSSTFEDPVLALTL
ncbi:GCN5-related N-acetyltransferase [Granulicella sibirica]|uniref:GCN5-related N-acetyltransferase n=1 Tax=Granulicella sibirica TaxID=2479048 RepID=A0A4Q0T4M1_9BACT|nr:GCN5-related N-acetyltransferase [Granulicella sibirica]